MNVRKKLLKLLITVIVMLVFGGALSAFSMTAASASADQPSPAPASSPSDASSEDSSADEPFCEGGELDGNGNCIEKNLVFGQATFSVDEKFSGSASLKLASTGKFMLNVNVSPMPAQSIDRCWKVKPDTVIKNEVVNPKTGKRVTISWRVPANDNTFCTKKGSGKQVYKKSCGNRVWNVPGHPTPPPSIPHVKGKFKIVDYTLWQAKLKTFVSKKLGGTIKVKSPDETCVATVTLNNLVKFYAFQSARFRSRSIMDARIDGPGEVQISAQRNEKLYGRLNNKIKLFIDASITATCINYNPDEETVKNPPTIQASSQVCVKQGETSGIIVATVGNPNPTKDVAQVVIGNQAQTREVQANSQVSFTFTGFAVGTYQVIAKLTNINKSVSTSVTVVQCAAEPTCEDVYGPGYYGDYPDCFKDGTTTPAPPPTAPGPNPPPADPGTPGSQCYSNETGQPVPPNADGTCPPGSS